MPPKKKMNYWEKKLDQIAAARKKQGTLYDRKELRSIRGRHRGWEDSILKKWLAKVPERSEAFENPSGIPLKRLYSPTDVAYRHLDPIREGRHMQPLVEIGFFAGLDLLDQQAQRGGERADVAPG